MSIEFKNLVIWVTGASSGIGEELAVEFSKQGAHLILSGRNIVRLKDVFGRLEGPGDVKLLPFDISDAAILPKKYQEALDFFGSIDLLVNNAGISQRSSVDETDFTTARKILEVNYFGNVTLAKLILPHFKSRGKGRIVVISSVAGKLGPPFRSSYAASKHALHGWYDAFRAENEHHGVKVHMVCPGYIKTQISINALTGEGNRHGIMDSGQAGGMSAAECARRIIRAIQSNRREVIIGKEKYFILLRNFLPGLYFRFLNKKARERSY